MEAMTACYGNPSSTHRLGREAKRMLDSSRATIAKALGCESGELYFTSCGSESDNWAIIRGAQYSRRGKHIITSKVEHDAVLKSMAYLEQQGFEVSYLSPAEDGSISADAVMGALRDDTALISLMLVNNETGSVTDIQGISKAVRAAGSQAFIHTDAVQGFMKVPFSAKTLGADMISISGHKIHAPKGIGALYIRRGLNLPPYIHGGGQESGKRAGTEPMPQIAAFAAAVDVARCEMSEYTQRMASLRQYAIERLSAEDESLTVIGGGAPHILSISMPGYRSEVLMNFLEARDIFVSKSSACKKGGRSHVLEAMGLKSQVIDAAIRISLSRFTTQEDIDALCDGLAAARDGLRTSLRR
jgi:cysteine desulfurase